jgi:hypothetical protein
MELILAEELLLLALPPTVVEVGGRPHDTVNHR